MSPLATQSPHPKKGKPRTDDVLGLCIHTCGSSIVEQAVKHGAYPLEWVVAYYLKPDSYWPHYVVGWDGHIVQLTDEREIALHVGITAEQRSLYASGAWREKINSTQWDKVWGSTTNPMLFYSNSSPNRSYIGLEMLPMSPAGHLWDTHAPGPGFRFTEAQHQAVAELAADIWARHGLSPSRSRVVGHEDLNPLDRWDKGGGWDPGRLRASPYFDWNFVYRRLGL